MIKFNSIVKTFGDFTVLDGLNLEIEEGKITFIVGKSGEGKSVTIKHIMGLMQPTSGEIIVDDSVITEFTEEQLMQHRKKIGLLFQHAALFDSMTVGENVIFPLQEHTQMSYKHMTEKAETILKMVGLPKCQNKYPSELSTGEKKRVGLARALINEPKIMLYDEPTTGMDPLVSEMIDNLIVETSNLRGNLTSIVISHDLKAAMETADNIIMLYKGKVALSGTPEQFRKTENPVVRQFFAGKVEGPMEFL